MGVIEIIGAIIGLIYLYFEYKASVWLWPVGILMSLFYVVIFFHGKFYADAMLNVYYIGASVYGLAVWTMSKRTKEHFVVDDKQEKVRITHTPTRRIAPIIAAALGIWMVLFFILKNHTDSPVPLGDAFTTSLSIVAMWMLAQKYLEQWLLWIIVNLVSVILYFWKGLYPTGVLYIVYLVVAVLGYFEWRKRCVNDSLDSI